MKDCNKKQCLISTVAVFAFIFAFDYLFHGMLLHGLYESTAHLWRPMEEMDQMMWMCIGYHFLLAASITCLYGLIAKNGGGTCETTGKPACPRKTGICFGMKLGVIMGLMSASSYIWMPIPGELAAYWFVGAVLQGIGIGLILSCTCKKKDCQTA